MISISEYTDQAIDDEKQRLLEHCQEVHDWICYYEEGVRTFFEEQGLLAEQRDQLIEDVWLWADCCLVIDEGYQARPGQYSILSVQGEFEASFPWKMTDKRRDILNNHSELFVPQEYDGYVYVPVDMISVCIDIDKIKEYLS